MIVPGIIVLSIDVKELYDSTTDIYTKQYFDSIDGKGTEDS